MSIHEARPERISSAAVESHGAAAAAAAHSAFHAEAYGAFGRSSSQSERQALASNDKSPEHYVPAPGEIVHNGHFVNEKGEKVPVLIIEQPFDDFK